MHMKICTVTLTRDFPFGVIALLLLLGGSAYAKDGFESVRCGSDIPNALLGKRMDNEPVAKIERRHKDLGLKDLGSTINGRTIQVSYADTQNDPNTALSQARQLVEQFIDGDGQEGDHGDRDVSVDPHHLAGVRRNGHENHASVI